MAQASLNPKHPDPKPLNPEKPLNSEKKHCGLANFRVVEIQSASNCRVLVLKLFSPESYRGLFIIRIGFLKRVPEKGSRRVTIKDL